MNIKKLSATLLATTLAAAFALAPATEVQAKQFHDYGEAWEDHNEVDPVIDEQVSVVNVEGVATGNTIEENSVSAEASKNVFEAAKGKGIMEDGDSTNYDYDYAKKDENGKVIEKRYYKFVNSGWSTEDVVLDRTVDGENVTIKLTYKFKHKEFKNNVTGETSFSKDALLGKANIEKGKVNFYDEKVKVYTKGTTDVEIQLTSGNVEIRNLKSSKKKIVKAKVAGTKEERTTYNYSFSKDAKGYYYVPVTGEKVYVPSSDVKVNKSSATVWITVYGVKNGKAKISFDVYDINGQKTGTESFTVVSNKERPIKEITFAGKSLEQGNVIGTNNSNYIHNGKDIDTFYDYTTKKSGKLKITTGDDYKLIKLQVGSLEKYQASTATSKYTPDKKDNYTTDDRTSVDSYSIETTAPHPVDLNGDGDYDDTINGMKEERVYFRYKTVKNGKKIKLSKVRYNHVETTEKSITYKNNADQNKSEITKTNYANWDATAPTAVRVTVLNKVTKNYETYTYMIYKKVKKF